MRRTRESITNEYNKFKGLKAEITNIIRHFITNETVKKSL